MGRKAKPINLHLVEGNKSRKTKAEIAARQEAEQTMACGADKVKPPKWLSAVAKAEFKRLAKHLMELKLVTNLDVGMLALYCHAYVDYIECTEIINRDGLTVEQTNKRGFTRAVPHPLLSTRKQLFDQMFRVGVDFGFTPHSRAKLAIPRKPVKAPTDFDRQFPNV